MKQTFFHTKRPIQVSIGDEYITFTYPTEGNREFYAIPKKEWISDRIGRQDRGDNWHTHMMEKKWFNNTIKNFIEANV